MREPGKEGDELLRFDGARGVLWCTPFALERNMDEKPWPTQTSAQIVQVDQWEHGDDPSVFPVGSKPKKLILCPDDAPFPFLIPGHRYLFKTTPGWREQQLWSEIIAYEFSKLCGIEVPPCFAAFDGRTGEAGVLMEFFYGYPDETQTVRFVAGSDIIQRADPDYDSKTGRPHEVLRNIAVCRQFGVPSVSALNWWAKTLALDALIGNTDRHAENWGLLRGGTDDQLQGGRWSMAPPFDHGTSLGYEIREIDLAEHSTPAGIEKHIAKGRHHCTWDAGNEKRGERFFILCAKLCGAYPRLKEVIGRVIPFEEAPIEEIVSQWVYFDLPVKFSAERAKFVERLIRARRNALAAALGL